MACQGWISIYRQIQEHWLWKDKPFSKGQAWIDLLMLANYEEKKMPYKGEIITCERGTVNLSISVLADRWGWSRKKTRQFLDLLETDGMVSVKATTHRTTITIENYGLYNDVGSTKEQQKNSKGTAKEQQRNTTNNINNINNINKDIYIGVPDELKDAFMEFANMRKTIKKPISSKQTVTRLLNKLDRLAGSTEEKIAILNRSADRCWQDVYELKGEMTSAKGRSETARNSGKTEYDDLGVTF